MDKKKLVVLTGAGISAESGISTFRDANGLWEGHDVMEVASIQGWQANPELVLEFYNQRRRQLHEVEPNLGHTILAELEDFFEVHIITQNVDNLHEQAGSSNIIHLHGELFKVRPSNNDQDIIEWKTDLRLGDTNEKGVQLRPHIVWFGEMVPLIEMAAQIASQADYFVVVGTSMAVYPAAGLIDYVQPDRPKFLIDPNIPSGLGHIPNLNCIEEIGSKGLQELKQILLS